VSALEDRVDEVGYQSPWAASRSNQDVDQPLA
ncbi:uncharacterized protein METZ01_LOCUS243742, partial [marine metagenome]